MENDTQFIMGTIWGIYDEWMQQWAEEKFKLLSDTYGKNVSDIVKDFGTEGAESFIDYLEQSPRFIKLIEILRGENEGNKDGSN